MIKQISIQFRTPTDLLLKLVGKLWTIIRGDGKEIGKNPVAIIKGIVAPIILFALLFPLSIKSSIDEILENKLKLLCK